MAHRHHILNSKESTGSRRPLKSRSTVWAATLAGLLTRTGVRPNTISAASLVFAAAAAVAMGLSRSGLVACEWALFLAAAIGIQLRLLCNLMDGMVAVEGKRKSATGELWNEIPDRLADSVLFVGAGFAADAPFLGAVVAMGALLTAYIRAFGAGLTGRQDFCGPMAKPHRMALLTAGCLLAAVATLWNFAPAVILVVLCLTLAGTTITSWRRIVRLAISLRSPRS